MLKRSLLVVAAALPWLVGPACSGPGATEPAPRPITISAPSLAAEKPVDFAGLHNVVTYSDGLICGSAPEGVGLETLASMGVRTILSVDGAQPDADAARALGMRYVHLPIGYDGIDEDRKLELARAFRDLPGPLYVHCHHGKHRSAGAAAAMGIALGRLDNEQALARMRVSGTAPEYKGLYACATDAHVESEERISSASNAFPSRWTTTDFVQGMVEIDDSFDRVKEIEKASWKAPKAHPDLVPAAEIGRISHVMRELKDSGDVQARPGEFMAFLDASIESAESLEKGILDGAAALELSARMKSVNQSCKDCHAKYRN